MPEETAVLESPESAEAESSELTSFDHTKYMRYVPAGTEQYYSDVFTNRSFGWKRRAQAVLKLAHHAAEVEKLEAYLVELSNTVPRSHSPRGKSIDPRDGLRAFIASLSNEKLQQLCSEKSVSYTSFMPASHPDKSGLIEALCDEMLG